MSVALSLTVWERLVLLQTLPEDVPRSKLNQYLRLDAALSLTPEERDEVGMANVQGGGVTWKDQERRFDVEIDQADFEVLFDQCQARQAWPRSPKSQELLRQLQDLAGRDMRPA